MNLIRRNVSVALINGVVVIGLLVAGATFLKLDVPGNLILNIHPGALPLIFILSVCVFVLSVAGWRFLLRNFGALDIPFGMAVVQVSVMLAAKYAPGKIWGVFARGMLARKSGAKSSTIISISLAEQYFSLYVGLSLSLTLIVYHFSSLLAVFAFTMSVACGAAIFNLTSSFFVKLAQLFMKDSDALDELSLIKEMTFINYIKYGSFFLFQWIFIGFIFLIVAASVGIPASLPDMLSIYGGYVLAVMLGFLALPFPGGIGIREAVFILVSSFMSEQGLHLLAYCAILLRGWNILYDLIFASFGYGLYLVKYQKESDVTGHEA